MAQQSAVEWLQDIYNNPNEYDEKFISKIDWEQAKQMEKEQIIAARMNRMTDDELSYQTAEEYYNETYNK